MPEYWIANLGVKKIHYGAPNGMQSITPLGAEEDGYLDYLIAPMVKPAIKRSTKKL
jgi:hypothetical protein